MGVVPFRSRAQRDLDETVDEIVALFGHQSGLEVRRFALILPPAERAPVLRIAEAVEERTGFYWYVEGEALPAA